MRAFITVLVLIFSLQSWTKADDISEFEIEGMSIGDSALKFFSEKKIKKNSKNYYKSKKYIPVEIDNFKDDNLSFFEIYDAVDFAFKNNDKNYIMESIVGVILYVNKNIKDCYKQMDIIVSDLDKTFPNQKNIQKELLNIQAQKINPAKALLQMLITNLKMVT